MESEIGDRVSWITAYHGSDHGKPSTWYNREYGIIKEIVFNTSINGYGDTKFLVELDSKERKWVTGIRKEE